MTLPVEYKYHTAEDRAIIAGAWRRGMANGGGPGLLTVPTLWADHLIPKHRMSWVRAATNRIKRSHDDRFGPISATLPSAVY